MKYVTPFLILLSSLLTGCVSYSPSIPTGYTGPKAVIKDTATVHSTRKIDYFYVEKVSGLLVENSKEASREANYGRGLYMQPITLEREVPAGSKLAITIVGKTEHAAPILAMTNAEYEVKGEIVFTPAVDGRYIVKGGLSKDLSEIWIEDQQNGQLVSEKIRPIGSAKLGFFEK
jgi:hypothetical protein